MESTYIGDAAIWLRPAADPLPRSRLLDRPHRSASSTPICSIQGAAIDSVYGLHEQALAKLSRAAEVAGHARIAQTSMFFSNLALREARARIGVGDALRARALLEEQLAALRAGPGVARQRAVLNAVLVHAFIALGDIPQANRAAEQAERELAREPRRANLVNADAQVERAMGQAAMAEGAFDRALPHLERAAALYRSIHVSDSPFRAEAEALRAACLAQLGRRDEAMAALALARVAQAEHGGFSKVFTRVLHQAETLAQAAAAPVRARVLALAAVAKAGRGLQRLAAPWPVRHRLGFR